MTFQLKTPPDSHTFDAIVVGSGISGGWAAKELTEKGLRVLMLERGRPLEHITGYETALKAPWDFPYRGRTPLPVDKTPPQYRVHTHNEQNANFWFNDHDAPYREIQPFDWRRPDILGGKSVMWGRQSYRWGDIDFGANARDGFGNDWPIRYKDIAPWYSYVEKFAGISGSKAGLPQLPDSDFLPAMPMNCVEEHISQQLKQKMNRTMLIGRTANLSQPNAVQTAIGRAPCQYRNMCSRGCPYGAYFSSQSATLPAARKTNRLTVRTQSIVSEVLFDKDRGRATGVRVVDAVTKQTTEYYARIIFLNASTVSTNVILLNSVSDRFPTGFGNDSGTLGRYVMDHHFQIGASGRAEGLGFEDKYYYGRRANGIYIPRYRNIGTDKREYVRGFGYQGGASRSGWQRLVAETAGFGAELKEEAAKPGPWTMGLVAFGECLPYEDNRITLDRSRPDKWGLPTVVFDVKFRENEKLMRKDMANDAAEMLEAAGLKHVSTYDNNSAPGLAIHEMGGVRMGRDPKTSMLNGNNQLWAAKNVFVTDGASFASTACQNPSLTFMALSARAADFAVGELKRKNL
ncbi:Gluconate 2-dehydrogenase flavoprotein [Fibrisoma limi BUZ 3]|uniref:Gluconate 2-dehydrogenase flavoprotein n=1 Tax=Fibrisoma limi BUZ 3 TaxID=1185876 RepID=I2GGC7_9BACT|nr:GMC family oxidoreductase [Fibrisoma limi]CCH52952.1 Gluconate 2-dehydrogenase flavoprotein [Fibrisoma limi BUZ 3]